MTKWEKEDTAVMDFGYIGKVVGTGEVERTGDPKKNVATIEFPELTGSEKQIAWAKDIRLMKLQDIERAIEGAGLETALSQFKVETAQEIIDFVMAGEKYSWLKTTTSAHSVIENRNR